ncbi:MAG: T9SS C-terminal target domain-containing protein [Cytophagales bacterium]|nr:MAG: T9SS C-terminal target domain-containing protein [Cytophagales bacterium]
MYLFNKKTVLTLSLLLGFGSFYVALSHKDKPDDSATGAPGEITCNNCHTGAKVNEGTGSIAINIDNGITGYELGKTYTVSVTVAQASLSTFGFEIVALQKSSGKNAGNFTLKDTKNSQRFTAAVSGQNRVYVGHTLSGIKSDNVGSRVWEIDWTAPSEDMGEVTFYTAGIAANGTGNRFGDFVYSSSTSISPIPTSLEDANLNSDWNVVVKDKILDISYQLPSSSLVNISLVDTKGNLIQSFKNEAAESGSNSARYDLSQITSGAYLLRFTTKNKNLTKKIIL